MKLDIDIALVIITRPSSFWNKYLDRLSQCVSIHRMPLKLTAGQVCTRFNSVLKKSEARWSTDISMTFGFEAAELLYMVMLFNLLWVHQYSYHHRVLHLYPSTWRSRWFQEVWTSYHPPDLELSWVSISKMRKYDWIYGYK